MNKKFIVFSDYGGFVPDVLKPLMFDGSDFVKNRYNEKIIDFIESNARTDVFSYGCKYFEEHKDVIGAKVTSNGTCYYAYSSDKRYVTHFDIVEIEDDKQYTLSEYDGAEVLEEVPKYECIDSNINLWRKVRK